MKRQRWLVAALMIAVLAVGIWLGYWQVQPPASPKEGDADFVAFQRMLQNIEILASVPHPAGSAANEKVREYLVLQIEDMGLQPVVEEIAGYPGQKNIWVKLNAPGNDKGIMLVSHYDSVPSAPGAGDDMVAVCAMLEALRQQAENKERKNDICFLFTDGEETALVGANAFVKQHPEMVDSVAYIANFEARGNKGGLILFETSAGGFEEVRYTLDAGAYSIAFSFLSAVYKEMPNYTDMTVFFEEGYRGANFAVVEGEENYHAPSDTPQNLNEVTAYQYYMTATALADHGSEMMPQDVAQKEGVYFSLLPGNTVLMTATAGRIVAVVAVLGAILWLLESIKARRISLKRVIGFGVLQLGCVAVFGFLSWATVSWVGPVLSARGKYAPNSDFVFGVLLLVVIAGTSALYLVLGKKDDGENMIASLLPLQLLLTLCTALFFNAISYLFALPLLCTVLLALVTTLPQKSAGIGAKIAAPLAGVLVLLLYVPVCWILYVALFFPVMPLVAALSAIPVSLCCVMLQSTYYATTQQTDRVEEE